MLMFIGAVDYVFIVLGSLIALTALFILGFKSYISTYYRRARRKKIDSPLSASELARANLDRAGLADVQVKIKFLTSGYSHRKKILYISKAMERKATIFSISRVMQLVSMAIIYSTDETARKRAWGSTVLSWTATVFFFIMIVVSLVVELASMYAINTVVLVLTLIALAFYVYATINSVKKGNLYKRANEDAMKYINNMGIFDDADIKKIERMYTLSAMEYTLNALLSILYLIYYAIKAVGLIFEIFGNKR